MSSLRQSNILYNGLNYTIHTGNKGGKYILVNNKKIYIKPKSEYHIYKGNKYIIETGNNGGKYILVNNKKHYLARGGGPEYENLTTKLKEYVQTDKTVQTHIYVHENINPSYFQSNKITDEVRKIYFPNIELNEITNPSFDASWIENICYDKKDKTKPFFVDWTIPDNATVLVVGDIHGGITCLESLFAHWIEMGFLLELGGLAADVYVVSLGDLIDYGDNSLNVLYTMSMLRSKNPSQVMLLSGNHEGKSQTFSRSGAKPFVEEIQQKGYNRIRDILLKNISVIGPDLLSLRFSGDNESIYMMHGMFPAKIKDEMYNEYAFIDHDSLIPVDARDIEIWNGNDTADFSYYTQWNDLSENSQISHASSRHVINGLALGMYHLQLIMRKFGIKAFIRGHQDSCPTQIGSPDMVECTGTIAVHVNSRRSPNLKCINPNTDKSKGWCSYHHIVEGLPDDTSEELLDVQFRVFTTSMAFTKHLSAAPPGGYIVLRQNEYEELSFNPEIDGGRKNKTTYKKKNIKTKKL